MTPFIWKGTGASAFGIRFQRSDLQSAYSSGIYQPFSGHEDIGSRKPCGKNWYDVTIGSSCFLNIIGKSILRMGLYSYNGDAFARLEKKKDSMIPITKALSG